MQSELHVYSVGPVALHYMHTAQTLYKPGVVLQAEEVDNYDTVLICYTGVHIHVTRMTLWILLQLDLVQFPLVILDL